MNRVILYGCSGRMGQVITMMAERIDNLTIVAGIDVCLSEREYQIYPSLADCPVSADVLLDFSSPKSLYSYLDVAIARKLAVVVATTGLGTAELELLAKASEHIPVFRSGSMSLGVNLVQQLIKSAAKVLGEEFDVEIIEKHHNRKIDSPSGTARTLVDAIDPQKEFARKHGREGMGKRAKEIGIHSIRGGTIAGEHTVIFAGENEVLELTHRAESNLVFAKGALRAVRFIAGKRPGLYNMDHVLAD